ncbi:hypothetical protein [Pseudarthrobacter siccitolerans]|uniref:hypothetical protein n=1 Tax=Pseudarthrobacter siccitolerans TaxID=861266 RepID=UPI0006794E6D|nr:hypothetical protein [Pseudarthrobacter siccitolerans]
MKLSLRRVLILFAAIFLALATGMAAAQAATTVNLDNAPQGAHFAKGKAAPTCSLNETTATVTCTGTEFAGVGNTDATVNLSLTATFTGVCRNPGNRNIVDPFTETVETEAAPVTVTSDKNGRLVIPGGVKVDGTSAQEFQATFDCPNPRWLAQVTDVDYSFEYSVTFEGFSEPAILITG